MTDEVKDVQVEEKVETEIVEPPKLSADEERAASRGWKTKEEFVKEGGSEDDWKPAKAFNEYGDLKERNIALEKDLKKANKTVAQVVEHHRNVRQSMYEQAVKDLKAQRQKALEEENFAAAEKVRDDIDDLREKFRQNQQLPAELEQKARAEEQKEPDPEFHAFMDRNPWYRPGGKDPMSKKADSLGYAFAKEYEAQHGVLPSFKDVITEVEKDIKKLFPEKFEKPVAGPVGGGNQAAGGSGGKFKYEPLSADEKNVAKAFGMTDEEYAKQRDGYKGK